MKTALIISLNFRVAHTSHLVASYKQMEELGYDTILFISEKLIPFLPKGTKYITSIKHIKRVDVSIFWFPAFSNLALMIKLKRRFKSKIIYVFHEPIERYKTYKEYGLSMIETSKVYARYIFNLLLIGNSNHVILPSKKALHLYQSSICKRIKGSYTYIPLMFDDEAEKELSQQRSYFSYIGTISDDHAFQQFLDFVVKASQDQSIPRNIKFLIATRNNVDRTTTIDKLETDGRLVIVDGKPLTDNQINAAYEQSFLVWNAYHRTTQSGVLAKASMFGTPAIILKKNASEFTFDGRNVTGIEDNRSYYQIRESLIEVWKNFESYSQYSRNLFENQFFYRIHNTKMREIIS